MYVAPLCQHFYQFLLGTYMSIHVLTCTYMYIHHITSRHITLYTLPYLTLQYITLHYMTRSHQFWPSRYATYGSNIGPQKQLDFNDFNNLPSTVGNVSIELYGTECMFCFFCVRICSHYLFAYCMILVSYYFIHFGGTVSDVILGPKVLKNWLHPTWIEVSCL